MQTTVKTVYQLVPLLEARLSGRGIVFIDGVSGAGKSALGAQLQAAFDRSTYIEVDDFLRPKEGHYVGALRLSELGTRLAETSGIRFVAGVCARGVAKALAVDVSAHVYVMRMDRFGRWADEEEALGNEIEDVCKAARIDPHDMALLLEVRDYHRRVRPHDTADFVLQRQEP